MMRDESYVLLYISILNKTILINNGYREASFIYDRYLSWDEVVKKGKQSLKPYLEKIAFSAEHPEKWIKRMEDTLFGRIEKHQSSDQSPSTPDKLKEYYSQSEIRTYYQKNPEEKSKLFILGFVGRKQYKIKGLGIIALARLFSLQEEKHYLCTDECFYKLVKRIFGEDNEMVIKFAKEKRN